MSTITGGTPLDGGILAVTTFAGQRLLLCSHVVERYQERVKPHLSMTEAAQDLARLLHIAGSQLPQAPAWLTCRPKSDYVALGPDVVIAVGRCGRSVVAITCLTPPLRKRATRRTRGRRVPRRSSSVAVAVAA